MADWSKVFEQRLAAVLNEDKKTKNGMATGAELELTPPPTAARGLQRLTCDPTAAFFDSIRKQSRVGAGESSRNEHRSGEATTPVMRVTPTPTPTPMLDPAGRPVTKELQESYSNRARDLHDGAMQRLSDVESALETQLARMAQDEEAFLSAVARKRALFGQPAAAWTVKVQTRAKDSRAAPVEKKERVVDRVAQMRTAAGVLEEELARLWQEWDRAQGDAAAAWRAIFGGGGSSGEDSNGVEANGAAAGFDQIMAEAEKELAAAAADATKETKENEKTFRKLILKEECKLAQAMLSRQSKYD